MWSLWVAFIIFILLLLALDLGVFHRKAHVIDLKEALMFSGVWIGAALVFNVSSISLMNTTGLGWTSQNTSRTDGQQQFCSSRGTWSRNLSA